MITSLAILSGLVKISVSRAGARLRGTLIESHDAIDLVPEFDRELSSTCSEPLS
jgi:hypothetical protein